MTPVAKLENKDLSLVKTAFHVLNKLQILVIKNAFYIRISKALNAQY